MSRKRTWDEKQLRIAVSTSLSLRSVLMKLNLVPAGGNYEQVKNEIKRLSIPITHFTGMGWRKNKTFAFTPKTPLDEILTTNSHFQSFKLKQRLFRAALKFPVCELCGWAERSSDGRIPVELDHINGDRYDNRLENLRILCPNCHSLQPTHRGKNQKRRGGEIGRRATLKML